MRERAERKGRDTGAHQFEGQSFGLLRVGDLVLAEVLGYFLFQRWRRTEHPRRMDGYNLCTRGGQVWYVNKKQRANSCSVTPPTAMAK